MLRRDEKGGSSVLCVWLVTRALGPATCHTWTVITLTMTFCMVCVFVHYFSGQRLDQVGSAEREPGVVVSSPCTEYLAAMYIDSVLVVDDNLFNLRKRKARRQLNGRCTKAGVSQAVAKEHQVLRRGLGPYPVLDQQYPNLPGQKPKTLMILHGPETANSRWMRRERTRNGADVGQFKQHTHTHTHTARSPK